MRGRASIREREQRGLLSAGAAEVALGSMTAAVTSALTGEGTGGGRRGAEGEAINAGRRDGTVVGRVVLPEGIFPLRVDFLGRGQIFLPSNFHLGQSISSRREGKGRGHSVRRRIF